MKAQLVEVSSCVPSQLSLEKGANYSQFGVKQISASNDVEAILVWLKGIRSPSTMRAYRKEIERFLLWCQRVAAKNFSDILLEDIHDYIAFMADPQPQEAWCGPRKSRASADWRPFEKPCEPASINQAIVILGGCFGFLVEAGYLQSNPCRLVKKQTALKAAERPKEQGRAVP